MHDCWRQKKDMRCSWLVMSGITPYAGIYSARGRVGVFRRKARAVCHLIPASRNFHHAVMKQEWARKVAVIAAGQGSCSTGTVRNVQTAGNTMLADVTDTGLNVGAEDLPETWGYSRPSQTRRVGP
jgi:hypothetical protein